MKRELPITSSPPIKLAAPIPSRFRVSDAQLWQQATHVFFTRWQILRMTLPLVFSLKIPGGLIRFLCGGLCGTAVGLIFRWLLDSGFLPLP